MVTPILKNCLVIYEKLNGNFELNTVEKYGVLDRGFSKRQELLEEAKDESYFRPLAFLFGKKKEKKNEGKIGGRISETL